jgi:radical SAM protein with 4Fe4S-binding SPASM domain
MLSRRSAPFRVIWYLTNRCNLRCAHCFREASPDRRPAELSLEQARAVVDQLADNEVFEVGFCGGEVLVLQWFPGLVEHCTSRGLGSSCFSNGLALTPDLAARLAGAGLQGVQISLDGATPRTHDAVRGPGTFARALDAVEACTAAGLEASVAFTIMRTNRHEVEALVDLCAARRIHQLKLQLLLPVGRAAGDRALPLTREGAGAVIGRFLALQQRGTGAGELEIKYPCFVEPLLGPVEDHGAPEQFRCGAGVTRGIIYSDGSVGACDFMPDEGFGDLRTDSFRDLWSSDHPGLSKWRTTEGVDGTCHACAYRGRCGYGCRAFAQHVGGDFYGWDPSCLCVEDRTITRAREHQA